jgi:outer membrane cobalamin receptor
MRPTNITTAVNKFFAVTIAGVMVSTISAVTQAQSTSSLDEIVVTAKSLEENLPQQLSQYGTHLDTISAAQIQDGGYIDVASALEALAPGLYISSINGPFDYVHISLQGSRTEDVLWLVDGIRINNRLYAGTTPLDTIPSSMVERIEVLDGGQALFYGTQAVAGAVNIVTKSFSDHPDGAVSVGGDSNNGKQVQGYFRDTIGSNHFVAYALHDESSGIQPLPDADYQPSGTDRHRSYKVTTVGGKYAYDFTDALSVTASYQHTNANLDFAQPMLTANAFNQRNEDWSAPGSTTPRAMSSSSTSRITTIGGSPITPNTTTAALRTHTRRVHRARSASRATMTSGGTRITASTC